MHTDGSVFDNVLVDEQRGYDQLVEPHLGLFSRGIYRVLQNEAHSKEALNSALSKIRSRLAKGDGRSRFPLWAYRICLDEALRVRRHVMRQMYDLQECNDSFSPGPAA